MSYTIVVPIATMSFTVIAQQMINKNGCTKAGHLSIQYVYSYTQHLSRMDSFEQLMVLLVLVWIASARMDLDICSQLANLQPYIPLTKKVGILIVENNQQMAIRTFLCILLVSRFGSFSFEVTRESDATSGDALIDP
jgi:uncharacterized membrane protein